MAYPKHYLVAFGGTLGSTEEQWVNTIRVAGFSTMNDEPVPAWNMADPAEYYTGEVLPALTAWLADPRSVISTQVKLAWVKINEIGPLGRYASETEANTYELDVPLTGTAAACPFHATVRLTFETGATRGYAARGGTYPPMVAASSTVGADGLISATYAQDMANAAVDLLNGLRFTDNVASVYMAPVIASPGRMVDGKINPADPGLLRRITSVKVGRVPDVQTRRSEKIPESYVAATTAIA